MTFHHTEETKRKLSEMRRGKNNPMFGKRHSPEARQRLAAMNIPKDGRRRFTIGPRTFPDLGDTDAAYLAGIVDGEGCITLPKRRNGIIITIGNTNTKLMDWLSSITLKQTYLRPDKRAREPFYVLTICGARDLAYVLERLRPFLIVKADRCDQCLSILRAKYGDCLNG